MCSFIQQLPTTLTADVLNTINYSGTKELACLMKPAGRAVSLWTHYIRGPARTADVADPTRILVGRLTGWLVRVAYVCLGLPRHPKANNISISFDSPVASIGTIRSRAASAKEILLNSGWALNYMNKCSCSRDFTDRKFRKLYIWYIYIYI